MRIEGLYLPKILIYTPPLKKNSGYAPGFKGANGASVGWLVCQLFMSHGGMKQIDLRAYIDSDDCKHALHEYSTDGQLVREIRLPSDVTEPQHAVQLGRRFVVTHAGTQGPQGHSQA